MLDDLRQTNVDDDFDSALEQDIFVEEEAASKREERHFLGMSPVERMFLSFFLFITTVVLGLAFLVATNRIAF